MLVGIDEAGRGPVLGPLVVCAAAVSHQNIPWLESLHLRDSKKYTPKKREELEKKIVSIANITYAEISAQDIDTKMSCMSLNDIEAELFVHVMQKFQGASKIYVDACDVNASRFGKKICQLAGLGVPKVVSEHKADDTYPIVSAASIAAKVRRDKRIEELKQVYGDFGSGYCSDERTIVYLKRYIAQNGSLPGIARSSWVTSKRLLEEHYQHTLDMY
ncbi:MAG: ribonuclease HII [Candidatus Methanofastidiosia archaeon]|jgi:ribonuclease HII